MSPTTYDIARIVGISKSTVSRALNKRTNVSPEMREKVLRVIEELRYQPNKLIRALTSSGSDTIVVISIRSTETMAGNSFFSEVLHVITAKVGEGSFDMILQTLHNPAEGLQECESKTKQKMIKGTIMLSSLVDELFFAQLDKYDILVVMIGKAKGQYAHVYSVDTDNFGDSITLTDALIRGGHQNIACLYVPFDVHVSVDHVNGYERSLAAHDIAVRDEWTVDSSYTHETALKAARQLLSQSSLLGTVFTADDPKLMNICHVAAEKNTAIPQQLTVVGYSNETLSFILTPAPGDIGIPTQELDQQSCELLFHLISGEPSPQNITVIMHMTLE